MAEQRAVASSIGGSITSSAMKRSVNGSVSAAGYTDTRGWATGAPATGTSSSTIRICVCADCAPDGPPARARHA